MVAVKTTGLSSVTRTKRMKLDPTYGINVTGNIKQMLKWLPTDKAKEIALHGGVESRQNMKELLGLKPYLLQGHKTAARIPLHMAGERTPGNAKMEFCGGDRTGTGKGGVSI